MFETVFISLFQTRKTKTVRSDCCSCFPETHIFLIPPRRPKADSKRQKTEEGFVGRSQDLKISCCFVRLKSRFPGDGVVPIKGNKIKGIAALHHAG